MIYIFGFTGTTQLKGIAAAIGDNVAADHTGSTGLLLGIILIIVLAFFSHFLVDSIAK
jgi:NADH:ubiquinone oxidoreductase subunit 2 (subunit N)